MGSDSALEQITGSAKPLAWRMFGAQQRALRERREMTQDELSKRAGYSLGHVRGIELGDRKPTRAYVEVVDDALGAEGVLLAVAKELIDNRHPEWFEEYAETEKAVRRLNSYATHALHGLLQTREYAEAVLSAYVPTIDDDRVEALVTARLERQALLTRKPSPTLGFVIEEWVLRRPVGGADVMRAQLKHLAACARMRNVSVQVLETAITSHAGFDGPMTLLEAAEGRTLGYLEVQGTSRFIAAPMDVGDLEARYGILRSQALSPERSISFIEDLAGAL
ncbi:helix-turn-helix domain-containing protein [Streptomyces sp. NPDC058989]|uniref:helix-turn-helix domain-containing protein n=1 Tax=Streptomyces sp. NPDC058989 TaxID=3346686 RepID=UPI0036C076F5